MNLKSTLFVVIFLSFTKITLAQNNKISANEFFDEKNPEKSFAGKMLRKYKSEWAYVDYETGDDTNCKMGRNVFVKPNTNSFQINNEDQKGTDIWVTFIRVLAKGQYKFIRKCYVKNRETFVMKHLEAGNYQLEIIHGTLWKQPLDFSCEGRFANNYSVEPLFCSKTYAIDNDSHLVYTSNNKEVAKDCEEFTTSTMNY